MDNLKSALEHRHMREGIEQKHGKAYFAAIRKLAVGDAAYDENGYLKPEYELTDEEKKVLTFIANDSDRDYSGKVR